VNSIGVGNVVCATAHLRLSGRTVATCVSIGSTSSKNRRDAAGRPQETKRRPARPPTIRTVAHRGRAGRPTRRRLEMSGPRCRAIRSSPAVRALRRPRARCAYGRAAGPRSASTTEHNASRRIRDVSFPYHHLYRHPASCTASVSAAAPHPMPPGSIRADPGRSPEQSRSTAQSDSRLGAPVTAAHRYHFNRRLLLAVSVRSLPP
jgi:hypothetical protein